jgi:hypothetical protein
MGIQEDATALLQKLADYQQQLNDPNRGHYAFSSRELPALTGMEPQRLNDAVQVLEDQGFAEVLRYLGTHPFEFGQVELTPRGRLEAERIDAANQELSLTAHQAEDMEGPRRDAGAQIATSPIPVGSPYGFTDEDWEAVSLDKSAAGRLIVVFGYQWQSERYDSKQLANNLQAMFAGAVDSLRGGSPAAVELDFRPLRAGYGEHLFNKIARDIIGSDVAIFDTSDQNPNVMIEMGVALTWGVRVLPIRETNSPELPSDISGQTWATYSNSGTSWVDPDHERKLYEMTRLALRKKGRVVI